MAYLERFLLLLCHSWDHSDELHLNYQRTRYRRLCPELETISMRQHDQRNIVPYATQLRQPLHTLFRMRIATAVTGNAKVIVFETSEPVIPLCINGAPGFSDPSRNAHVSPVIYGPSLESFHRDFANAVGEYYSSYIFLLAMYLQEIESTRAQEGLTDEQWYEFHLPCPSHSGAFAWFYSDAMDQSANSRADSHVYHVYQHAIYVDPNDTERVQRPGRSYTTIWEIFADKAAQIIVQAHSAAVDNLVKRGNFKALERLKRTTFRFSSRASEDCPCDDSLLKSLDPVVMAKEKERMPPKQPRGEASAAKKRTSQKKLKTTDEASEDDEKRTTRTHHSTPVDKLYHDKLDDSDSSDKDDDLLERYKKCRFGTRKNGVPVYGPCITSREVEDNVPPGICWGHWYKYQQKNGKKKQAPFAEKANEAGDSKEEASSNFCSVM